MPKPTPTDWAYLAAFVEADGCLAIRHGRLGRYYARITVTQKYPDALIWMQQVFGGALNQRKTPHGAGSNRDHKWVIESGKAPYIVKGIYPFMKDPRKRRRAQLLWILCKRPSLSRQAAIKQELHDISGYSRG